MTTEQTTPAVPAPIRRERAVEVYGNRFGRLYDDEVAFPGGSGGRYLRWQWNQQGVVVVPVGPEGLALLPMYRYPVGAVSLEFPRGGCDAGEDPAAAAARELEEEAGLVALSVRKVGVLHADTGLIGTQTHVCLAEVDPGRRTAARPEASESVARPVWAAPGTMAAWLREGRIGCAITIAAFAMATAALETPVPVPSPTSPATP
ncbi:NUDIX domain-containing protein [Streptomyces bambusae]|uniref:NUDIX domain-containing protein n=1 Tax=Streptomyces bambusae TaxID=1550616 RepID=UPI001CFCEC47|nr:NUDIX domain-containing protein [Streptomyces bambusae]MCB5167504.1 NUDIX domain-containing protein [Streptomyces bambusae]